jgi:peptidase C25-like protein
MPKIDKVILTNLDALREKYGTEGLARIHAGVEELIRADAARGLASRLVAVDRPRVMEALGSAPVIDATSPRENKIAIDGVYRALRPDYLVILGSTDVVPHQDLRNPLYTPDPDGDDDIYAFGDLPYACEAPYSREAQDFRGPTRVVGRLPDVTGARRNPAFLLRLLRTAARYRTRDASAYQPYFGLSARVWRRSTELSIKMLTGSTRVRLSPRQGPAWSSAALAPRMHFINCHGATADPKFYGQRGEMYPVAHRADRVYGRVHDGTVVAAECCYGAELYNPAMAGGERGICYAYLAGGAYGFFGSSTIAYGPSSGNGWADLLCRYVLEAVLIGASLGRAVLEARQRYIRGMSALQPEDVKTLAQFSLLGDPSIHPVGRALQGLEATRIFRRAVRVTGLPPGRELRRDMLLKAGVALNDTVGTTTGERRRRPTAAVKRAITAGIRDSGAPRIVAIHSFGVREAPGRTLAAAKIRPEPPATAVHVGMAAHRPWRGLKRIVLVSATVKRGRIVRLRRLRSR